MKLLRTLSLGKRCSSRRQLLKALGVSAAVVLIGVAVFLAMMPADERRRAPSAGRARSRLGALSAPGIRTLVLAMVPVGFAFGSLEVALPAFADSHDKREVAGVLLACWSVGSGVGGLIYGARARRAPLVQVHLRMAILLPFPPRGRSTGPGLL